MVKDVVLRMQLNVLIHLAMVDGQISKGEKACLESIAGNRGVAAGELEEMINHPKPIESFGALSNDLKFEYLYSIVHLMNIDGDIDKREINFCQNMALRLGYYKEVIEALWDAILDDNSLQKDRDEIKRRIQRYNPYN